MRHLDNLGPSSAFQFHLMKMGLSGGSAPCLSAKATSRFSPTPD